MLDSLSFTLLISAFGAGVLTFLAPCTLPLVPGYLGLISGVSREELADPDRAGSARRRIVKNGLFFIFGFSLIFIIFGAIVGLAGQALAPFQNILIRAGGVVIIVFGLAMTGVLKLKILQVEKRLRMPSWLTPGKPASSFFIGALFAIGWTPCVGPILGSILILASSTATVSSAVILLFAFSLGLALPFLAVAVGFSSATRYIKSLAKYINWLSVVGGVFLVLLGLLLATGNFQLLIVYGYRALEFVNYEAILEYL